MGPDAAITMQIRLENRVFTMEKWLKIGGRFESQTSQVIFDPLK